MRNRAQVVIIGGGVVGCSIAYHLAKRGLSDVALLERTTLTAGSTWHAAGGFHTLNGNLAVAAMQKYSIGLYDTLGEESGQDCGLHRTGALYLAADDDWAEAFLTEHARAKAIGVDLAFVSREEVRRLAPVVDADAVVCAMVDPGDGHLDPYGTTMAFAAVARRLGVSIEQGCPVLGTHRLPGGGWRVTTPQGDIDCETVVNAAGLWAREVAGLAGLRLPLVPMEHQYFVTERLPQIAGLARELPTIADFSSGSYMRQEGGGLLFGTYEQDGRFWSADGTPADFGQDLLRPDLDRIAPSLEGAARRVPCLADAGIRRVVNGPIMFSPDGNPLIGPMPEMPSYFVATGVLAGFSQSGGIGLALANWIAEGEPGMDVWGMDVARFGDWATEPFVQARALETYRRRYAVTRPNQHLEAARPLRTTPLYDRLQAQGALFGCAGGWEYPAWFGARGERPAERPSFGRSEAFERVRGECLAVRDAAGLFETSAYAKFEIEGPGAGIWLDGIVSSAVPAHGIRTVLAPLLTRGGRLCGDVTLTRLGHERYLLIGSPSAQAHYWRLLTAPSRPADVRISDRTSAWGGLAITGPRSRELLQALTSADLSSTALPMLGGSWVALGAARALLLRISFTGELGFEIYLPSEQLRHVHDLVWREGQTCGLRPFGVNALNALRIEKAYPSWGAEITEDVKPEEAGLSRFVRREKRGVTACDGVSRHDRPAALRLCSFVFEPGDIDPVGAEPVLQGDRVIGRLSSAAFGHRLGRAVALGYVPSDRAREGEAVDVLCRGRRLEALIRLRSPYDPDGLRLRA